MNPKNNIVLTALNIIQLLLANSHEASSFIDL